MIATMIPSDIEVTDQWAILFIITDYVNIPQWVMMWLNAKAQVLASMYDTPLIQVEDTPVMCIAYVE